MPLLTILDETAGGSILYRLELEINQERLTVGELITRRVPDEVAAYNARQTGTFQGLVQPTESERVLFFMRLISLLAGTAIGLLASSCHTPSQLPAQATQHPRAKDLMQTWRHSQEEDQGVVQVFRPASYHFPSARGREGYTFAPGGQLTKLAIASTDSTLPLPGHWRWASARALHLTFDDSSQQDCRLAVLELTSDVLKVKVLQPR